MRLNFVVKIFDIKLHLPQAGVQDIKDVGVHMDFATYKKFAFTPLIKVSDDGWRYTHSKENPLVFRYRTDWGAQALKPKELRALVLCSHREERKGLVFAHYNRLDIGNVGVSLHTLATGPQEYHLRLTMDNEAHPYFEQATLSFMCLMNQECTVQYRVKSLQCPPFRLPEAVRRHPNAFWFEPCFAVDVWYVSQERMNFAQHTDHNDHIATTPKETLPFHIADTTDMLENAHFFLQFTYNDRPWGHALLPLFREFNPGNTSGEYMFRLPLSMYDEGGQDPLILTLCLQIMHGPTFWPMKNGIATESLLLSGTSRRFFPRPKLNSIVRIESREEEVPMSMTPAMTSLKPGTLPLWTTTVSKESPSVLVFHQLDTSQKALLECYFNLGFSKEWVKRYLVGLIDGGR
jgi:hypothetical protein